MPLKRYFLSGALSTLLFGGSGTSYAILKEGIIGNINVKLYKIRTGVSGGDIVLRKSLRKTDGLRTKTEAQVSLKVIIASIFKNIFTMLPIQNLHL